ncbi:hypothetical protein [Salinigranum marinum]|uniref:hypothetical protein n=1 Tax=Salinigranum marinum TaxID=1515595 RepID=UPI002989B7C7|nr:hypothetical protein [Salinigranum marinum]
MEVRPVIRRLLTLPFRLLGVVFEFAVVLVMVEFFGLTLYLWWANEAALDAFLTGVRTPAAFVSFLLAAPDRSLVAGGLAVLAVFLVLSGESGTGTSHVHDGGFGGDGGVGGFGGDGGDGGGGGGGE